MTYYDFHWLRIIDCIDSKPRHAISCGKALDITWVNHHCNTLCRRAIRIQNLNLQNKAKQQ